MSSVHGGVNKERAVVEALLPPPKSKGDKATVWGSPGSLRVLYQSLNDAASGLWVISI